MEENNEKEKNNTKNNHSGHGLLRKTFWPVWVGGIVRSFQERSGEVGSFSV
jgi:hypothetical protein